MSDFEFEKDDCPLVDIEYQRGYQQGIAEERKRIYSAINDFFRKELKKLEPEQYGMGGYRILGNCINQEKADELLVMHENLSYIIQGSNNCMKQTESLTDEFNKSRYLEYVGNHRQMAGWLKELQSVRQYKDNLIDKLQDLLSQETLGDGETLSDVGIGIEIALNIVRGGENE